MTMEWSKPPQREEPESTYAIAAWVNGEPRAFGRVLNLTASRALFLLPGLYVAGVREPKLLAKAAVGASLGISGSLAFIYWLRKRRQVPA